MPSSAAQHHTRVLRASRCTAMWPAPLSDPQAPYLADRPPLERRGAAIADILLVHGHLAMGYARPERFSEGVSVLARIAGLSDADAMCSTRASAAAHAWHAEWAAAQGAPGLRAAARR